MKLSSMMNAERSTRLFTSVSPLSRPQFKFQTKSFCQDDIAALNRGSTRQEVLSGELQAGIADMADIDRSVELFTWLWNSMRGGDRSTDKSLELAPQEGGQALAQGVTGKRIFLLERSVRKALKDFCIKISAVRVNSVMNLADVIPTWNSSLIYYYIDILACRDSHLWQRLLLVFRSSVPTSSRCCKCGMWVFRRH